MSRQEINDTRLAHSRLSGECQLNPFTPSVARTPSILLTIDRRSPVKSSRSRCARRASSSASFGIGTIEQTRGSPRSQAISVRSSISTSITFVFARRARRSTGRLDGCITWTSLLTDEKRAKLRRARSGEFAARNSMSGGRRAGCCSDQVYRGRASGFQGAATFSRSGNAKGFQETEASITSKPGRGTFAATFFLASLAEIGCEIVRLEDV